MMLLPTYYQITVQGQLDQRWAAWFDELTISAGAHGQTIFAGPIVDQAALYGVLLKLQNLGLPLIAVQQIAEPEDHMRHTNNDS